MNPQLPDLPETAPALTDTLATTHQIVEFTPDEDVSLAYRLALPRGWRAEGDLGPARGGIGRPQLIGLFAPAPEPAAPFVSVSVTRMPVEIDLEDWVDYACARDGWETFATKWVQTPQGLAVDGGALKKAAPVPAKPPSASPPPRDVMRVLARADGGRIFMVSGVAPETMWYKWKHQLLLAGISFELVQPTGNDQLEPLREWEGGAPAFGLAFPASWQLQEPPSSKPGKSAVDLRLTQGEKLLAYLRVKATDLQAHPDTRLDTLVGQAQRELAAAGFRPAGKWIFPAHDPLGARVPDYQGTALARGRMWNQDVETRSGFRLLPDLAISVSLISVVQEQNPLLWMRAKRAFELVRRLNWQVGQPATAA